MGGTHFLFAKIDKISLWGYKLNKYEFDITN